mmetsp:Transcript_6405/g.11570  ORF Transcript_6405/g.11570 Transcript_6405/m.11570 type:complete len:388 (-) Transcript_6405:32-1195(-)
MEREGVQRVVDLELQDEYAEAKVHARGEDTNHNGKVRGGDCARGGDTDGTGKSTVEHCVQVKDVVLQLDYKQGSQATSGSCQGGCHARSCNSEDGSGICGRVHDGKRRSWVESVPSEPEEEGSQAAQSSGVTRHRHYITLGVESASSWTDDDCAHKTCPATNRVDDSVTSKVNHAARERVGVEHVEPSIGGPHPMGDDWVDKGGQEERISQVRVERGSFCDGSRHNGCGGGGKGPLEEPEPESGWARLGQAKVGMANERVGCGTKRKGEAANVIGNSTHASVQQVLKQHVLGVLGSHGTRSQHSKAYLHDKHKVRREEHEDYVQAILDVVDLSLKSVHVNGLTSGVIGKERHLVEGVLEHKTSVHDVRMSLDLMIQRYNAPNLSFLI